MSLQNSKVSLPVIKRLPKYYRYLADMKKNGVIKVSSSELAHMMAPLPHRYGRILTALAGLASRALAIMWMCCWTQ